MGDVIATSKWETHIVLACITCEKVVLFIRHNADKAAACDATEMIMHLAAPTFNSRVIGNGIINPFIPTVCASCDTAATSWTSLSISKGFIETWQPYLAMNAFLEGDLSMLQSSMRLLHRAKVIEIAGSGYMIRGVVVNPSPGAAAHVLHISRVGSFRGLCSLRVEPAENFMDRMRLWVVKVSAQALSLPLLAWTSKWARMTGS